MPSAHLSASLRVAVILIASAILSLMPTHRALAQTTFGTLCNFDVFNDTGEDTHGFEIELDGISSSDVTYTFGGTYERYGDPQLVNFAGGVYVRYESSYINNAFTQTTPIAPTPITPTAGHACWTGGSANYLTSGCEHFGVGLAGNPTNTVYRWLIADPQTPGNLIRSGTTVSIPAPTWNVNPQPGGPPMVQAMIPAEPAQAFEFGDAQWVKVYKTESPNPADLNHLVTDDPAVPQDSAEVETEWYLLQTDSQNNNAAGNDLSEEGALGAGHESVTRRYEFYKYVGAYDPENHEAIPQSESSPVPSSQGGDLGDYIGAQMAAVNLASPSATPTPTPTPSASGSATPTPTPTAHMTATPTLTPTTVATATPTPTPTPTAVPTPLPGQLAAMPGTLNLGNAVYGGLDGAGQTVSKVATIVNKSKISPAPIAPAASGDFTVTAGGTCAAQLAANGKCTIAVRFQPSDFGRRSGTLSIDGVKVANLTGSGVNGRITVSPGAINFGSVKVGTPAAKPVTLTDQSPGPIEVSDIEVTADTTDFSADKVCIGALSSTCTITVTFTPGSSGKKSAMLQITDVATGSPHRVRLTGIGF